MAWTYDSTHPSTRDEVRFYCGDKDSTDQLVADETIDAMLLAETNVMRCASLVCRHLAARFTRYADTVNGALSITDAAGRAKGFIDRAEDLERQAAQASGFHSVPKVGGVSRAQVDRLNDDSTAAQPSFKRGMFRNTRVGG